MTSTAAQKTTSSGNLLRDKSFSPNSWFIDICALMVVICFAALYFITALQFGSQDHANPDFGVQPYDSSSVFSWAFTRSLCYGVAAVIVLFARRYPGAAIAGLWGLFLLQLTLGIGMLDVDVLAAMWVGVAAGSYRSWRTMVGSLLAIPLSALGIAVGLAIYPKSLEIYGFGYHQRSDPLGYYMGAIVALTFGISVFLGMFWLLGALIRMVKLWRESRSNLAISEAERLRAQERSIIAQDVHDVVGHSLTVILAQAQSAEFLQTEPELRATLGTIADTSREALRDIRGVLTDLRDPGSPSSLARMRSPIENLRATGFTVNESVLGTPRPLPPDISLTAFRILQELSSNIVKYGDVAVPIQLNWRWTNMLEIDAYNAIQSPDPADKFQSSPGELADASQTFSNSTGLGLESMRRRANALGGEVLVSKGTCGDGQPAFRTLVRLPLHSLPN